MALMFEHDSIATALADGSLTIERINEILLADGRETLEHLEVRSFAVWVGEGTHPHERQEEYCGMVSDFFFADGSHKQGFHCTMDDDPDCWRHANDCEQLATVEGIAGKYNSPTMHTFSYMSDERFPNFLEEVTD